MEDRGAVVAQLSQAAGVGGGRSRGWVGMLGERAWKPRPFRRSTTTAALAVHVRDDAGPQGPRQHPRLAPSPQPPTTYLQCPQTVLDEVVQRRPLEGLVVLLKVRLGRLGPQEGGVLLWLLLLHGRAP